MAELELVGGAAATASPTQPLTLAELDAIVGTLWEGLDEDETRFNDLLWDSVTYIGTLATRSAGGDPRVIAELAARTLRDMEQRALWGPNLEQEDHR